MRHPAPIFREENAEWRIDTCEPQLRAIAAKTILFHGLTHGAYPGDALGKSELPGLSGIGHWQTLGPQDWGVPTHRNEGVEICWCETGTNTLALDESRHRLHAGVISVTRPWEAHRLGAPHIGEGRLHWIILDVGVRRPNEAWRWPTWIVLTADDRNELTRRLLRATGPLIRTTPALCETFRELARAVAAPARPGTVSTLAIRINDLLLRILETLRDNEPDTEENEQPGEPDAPNTRTVRLFWEDLRKNPGLLRAPVTVRTMAADCGVGVTTFIAHTRSITGATPMERLADLRLDHAAALLRESGLSVAAIARECGFASSQYFITRFGKKFGVTPAASREKRAGAPDTDVASEYPGDSRSDSVSS
jgi:AraC-like DNA-binding protein